MTHSILTSARASKKGSASYRNHASLGVEQSGVDYAFFCAHLMTPLLSASIVLACVFSAALLGLWLRNVLPQEHLRQDSQDLIKLGIGLIATLAALVLGLLISSAKSAFDKVNDDLVQIATKIVLLDRLLSDYGPEANEARGQIKQMYANLIKELFSEDQREQAKIDTPFAM